jgi:hypothetical protein
VQQVHLKLRETEAPKLKKHPHSGQSPATRIHKFNHLDKALQLSILVFIHTFHCHLHLLRTAPSSRMFQ